MAQVQVIFPPKGEPIVIRYETCVRTSENIHWFVHSFNPDVESVSIEFAGGARFFENAMSKPPDRCDGQLEFRIHDSARALRVGEAVLAGKAPRYAAVQTIDKYSVVGWDKEGGQVVSVDPKIITDGP